MARHATRIPSHLFNGAAFGFTAAALVLAPVLAGLDLAGSYLPYLLLRMWMIGFCIYGAMLARRAGGPRRAWQAVYVVIALPFALVWGLEVEQWAVIDLSAAALIGLSALFLRSEPGVRLN